MAKGSKGSASSLSNGNKVAIGAGAFLLFVVVCGGEPDEDDAWTEGAPASENGTAAEDTDDAWSTGAPSDGGGGDDGDGSTPVDDPWTRGSAAGDDDDGGGSGSGGGGDDGGGGDPAPPPDDPWTRGAPPGASDGEDGGSDDESGDPPADDPWTRGQAPPDDDDGPPPCVSTMEFPARDATVQLPTDRRDEAFASADCAIGAGRSGAPVFLVQVALNDCNGQAIRVTGTSDDATRLALAAVQSRAGLAADGVYGSATRQVMAWPTAPDDGGAPRCQTHPELG